MILTIEWAPIAGLLVGLIVGLTGVGGGALMAPILLIGFGYDLQTVIATDLLFATITKLASSTIHSRNDFIDWQVTRRLWAGSVPATAFVLLLVGSGSIFSSTEWLMFVLSGLIVISALSFLYSPEIQATQQIKRIQNPEKFKRIQAPATTVSGIIIGILVALTSIGAGAIGAAVLRALYPLRMTPSKLIATDSAHAIPVSLLAGVGYLSLGMTDLQLLYMLLLGSVPAAIVGSSLLKYAPQNWIKNALGIMLLIAAAKLLN